MMHARMGLRSTYFRTVRHAQRCRSPSTFPVPRKYSTQAEEQQEEPQQQQQPIDVEALRQLPKREHTMIWDDLTPGNSWALRQSLMSFMPDDWSDGFSTRYPLCSSMFDGPLCSVDNLALPQTHHLVYFNPVLPESQLLPDGTDPRQSPGEPFVRRMWAGGSMRFRAMDGGEDRRPFLDGRRYVCVEGIRDVQVKGVPGEEKIYVDVERRIAKLSAHGTGVTHVSQEEGDKLFNEDELKKAIWPPVKAEEFGTSRIIEKRILVFMRERTREQAAAAVRKQSRTLKVPYTPDFTHTFVPTPALLFRYSALTFNAHAIHLDPHYCRTVEGHRDLLFHGPLSITCLIEFLAYHLRKTGSSARGGGKGHPWIDSLDYRNVDALYCNQPVKLCGRIASPGTYDMWIEKPDGGVAVKAKARLTSNFMPDMKEEWTPIVL